MSYRKVDQKLWTSSTFRSMSEDARTLYQYLLTSPHNNALCCYVLPDLYAAHDLQWLPERLREPFEELLSKRRPDGTPMIYRDEAGVTFVHGQLLKEGLVNGNAVKAAIKALDAMPTKSAVYARVLGEVKALASQTDKRFHKPLIEQLQERTAEPSQEPIGNPRARVQEQEQEQDKPSYSPPFNPERKKPKRDFKIEAREVLAYLNDVTGKNFSDTSQIEARLKAGGTIDQCKRIIDTKRKDPHFQETPKYFNPVTLFRKKHWDVYLNERPEDFKPRGDPTGRDPWVCRNCGRRVDKIIDGLCPACRDHPVASIAGVS